MSQQWRFWFLSVEYWQKNDVENAHRRGTKLDPSVDWSGSKHWSSLDGKWVAWNVDIEAFSHVGSSADALGRRGWDLVSIQVNTSDTGSNMHSWTPSFYVFKRPINEAGQDI